MRLFRPAKEFPTPLFLYTIVFIFGAVAGGGGIYWYARSYDFRVGVSENNAIYSTSIATVPVLSIKNWAAYSNSKGLYSIKYPSSWSLEVCPATPGVTDLSPVPLAVCNGQNPQIQIFSLPGDQRANNQPSHAAGYGAITSSSVSAAGVSGKRYRGGLIAKNNPGGWQVGTAVVTYLFYSQGRTYVATYHQEPSGVRSRDVLSSFDVMVQKTLSFSR